MVQLDDLEEIRNKAIYQMCSVRDDSANRKLIGIVREN